MAIKMMVLVKRKSGLTVEEFRDGYEGSHSRIAVELFGHLWSEYRRNYLQAGHSFAQGPRSGDTGSPDEFGYDAISEFILRDEAARAEMGRISAENYDRLREDEARWFELKHCWVVTCETIEEDLGRARV